jgi:Uma2 family endonuclease
MSTATAIQPETRIVIPNISWEIFDALSNSDCGGTRFAYDRGYLEIMSPSIGHERFHHYLGRMIEALAEELNIPILSAGSTTLKLELKQKGVEADECFYLTHEAEMRDKLQLDLTVDPPPELALEVDLSHSSLDKLAIYADLGVSELWFFDGEVIQVYQLQDNKTFLRLDHSPTFQFLDLREIANFMRHFFELGQTAAMRNFRIWVRQQYGHLAH